MSLPQKEEHKKAWLDLRKTRSQGTPPMAIVIAMTVKITVDPLTVAIEEAETRGEARHLPVMKAKIKRSINLA